MPELCKQEEHATNSGTKQTTEEILNLPPPELEYKEKEMELDTYKPRNNRWARIERELDLLYNGCESF